MFTTSVILHSRSNKEGKYQLAIRITKNRKSSYVFLGQYIDKRQWDQKIRKVKKSHPNSSRLNAFILKKLSEVNSRLLTGELTDKENSAQDVHKNVLKKDEKNSFFEEAQKYIKNLREEGKYNQYNTDKPRIERFRNFLKGKDIKFQDVTVSLLLQFKAFLKGKYKVSERTTINCLILIRTIYNRAIKSGIVEQKYYPFGRDKIVIRFPDSEKLGLSKEEVTLIEEIDLSHHPKMNHSRNLWLFSFYFAGMRVSDVFRLRWADFQEGRMVYKMVKNNKIGSLKIPEKARAILDQYKD